VSECEELKPVWKKIDALCAIMNQSNIVKQKFLNQQSVQGLTPHPLINHGKTRYDTRNGQVQRVLSRLDTVQMMPALCKDIDAFAPAHMLLPTEVDLLEDFVQYSQPLHLSTMHLQHDISLSKVFPCLLSLWSQLEMLQKDRESSAFLVTQAAALAQELKDIFEPLNDDYVLSSYVDIRFKDMLFTNRISVKACDAILRKNMTVQLTAILKKEDNNKRQREAPEDDDDDDVSCMGLLLIIIVVDIYIFINVVIIRVWMQIFVHYLLLIVIVITIIIKSSSSSSSSPSCHCHHHNHHHHHKQEIAHKKAKSVSVIAAPAAIDRDDASVVSAEKDDYEYGDGLFAELDKKRAEMRLQREKDEEKQKHDAESVKPLKERVRAQVDEACDLWMAEPAVLVKDDPDGLLFWKTKGIKNHPLVWELVARGYLGAPGGNSSSERIFNITDQIMNKKRNPMKEKARNALILLHENSGLFSDKLLRF